MLATSSPEPQARYRAQQLLLAASIPVGFVHRIYSAGDALCDYDSSGYPHLTILFTTSGAEPEPATALIMEDGSVTAWHGW